MTTQLIILNGGSSSGKSVLARCLQAVLPRPWLTFGTDTFVEGLPASLRSPSSPSPSSASPSSSSPSSSSPSDSPSDAGIEFADDGTVTVGPVFRELEAAWITGITAMARAGSPVIVDEVFLGGAQSQQRWERAAEGLGVLWVGVRCAAAVAAEREVARGDRAVGMAAAQAELVHRGVRYDLEVDTAHAESMACARLIAARVS
ncbi:chloramphenicol phosphotransferase CPT family protein [Kitasatospora sp. NBC_01266]|uniref:chloramphenicol phosphotransferase CPT family protein n=1 Tax=Kitasatospora sp. NBC_01266 TaxID=2903572 RepID=UPI002E360A4E|nr:chloramphenicol phosphotransferase [Kitasatospora sp. NBC_01266]